MSKASPLTYLFRPGVAADLDSIKSIFRSRRTTMPWLPDLHSDAEDRSYVENVVLASQAVTVAEIDQRVIGFIALSDGWVEHLYIAPDFHRRGIGRELIAIAKSANPGGLRLWCFQRNEPGRTFYEAMGFVVEKATSGRDNEEKEPDLLYHWSANSGL